MWYFRGTDIFMIACIYIYKYFQIIIKLFNNNDNGIATKLFLYGQKESINIYILKCVIYL